MGYDFFFALSFSFWPWYCLLLIFFLLLTFPQTHTSRLIRNVDANEAFQCFYSVSVLECASACVCAFAGLFFSLVFRSVFARRLFVVVVVFLCARYWGCEFFFSGCCRCRRRRRVAVGRLWRIRSMLCRRRHLAFISDRHRSHSSIHNTLSSIKINVIRASAKTLIPNDYYLLA